MKERRQRAAIERWFLLYHPLRAFPQDVKCIVNGIPAEQLQTVVGNCLRILREEKAIKTMRA
jgi:hypothetical protein